MESVKMPKRKEKGLLSKTEAKKEFTIWTKVDYAKCMDPLLKGDKLKLGEVNELCCQDKYEVVNNFEAMSEWDKDTHLYSSFGRIEGHKSDRYVRK